MDNSTLSLQQNPAGESINIPGSSQTANAMSDRDALTKQYIEQLNRINDCQLRYIIHTDKMLTKINDKLAFFVFIAVLPIILGIVFLIISVVMGANIFSWIL